jgi:hypothetical protein
MIKYRYTIGNQMIEVLNIPQIPSGIPYETIEVGEIIEQSYLTQQALEIDLHYTGLISDLLRKHIEKLSIDNIPIPQSAIDERDRLRAECNQKILDLGITSFSYRQQNLKL